MIRNSLNILKRFNNIGKSSISNKSFTTSNILLAATTSHKFINKSSNDNRIIDTIFNINNNNTISNYGSSLKIINSLNSNDNGILKSNNNRRYCSKLPPPLTQGNGPIVVRSRKEALTIYFTMLFAIALLGVLYYIWYLKFKRLEDAVKSLDELENLSEDDIKKIVHNDKQRKQKESEKVKDDAPVDRILK